MKRLKRVMFMTTLLSLGGVSFAAEGDRGNYPWCETRIDNLKEQMELAKQSGDPKRINHIGKQMILAEDRCGLRDEPRLTGDGWHDQYGDHPYGDRDYPLDRDKKMGKRGDKHSPKPSAHHKKPSHKADLSHDKKRAKMRHADRLAERHYKIEKRILKQKEAIIHLNSDIRKAELEGDHLKVQLMKEDLERERQILELYNEELDKLKAERPAVDLTVEEPRKKRPLKEK